jgi:hypothetical protein
MKPKPGQSGAGEVASSLASGLRVKGFNPSTPLDQEYAHFFRCKSGYHLYEVMVGFDFVDEESWEVSYSPIRGFFARLFSKVDENELSALSSAILETMRNNPHVKDMHWYPKYGDTSYGSPNPII